MQHLLNLEKRHPHLTSNHVHESRINAVRQLFRYTWNADQISMAVFFRVIWMMDTFVEKKGIAYDEALVGGCLSLASKYEREQMHFLPKQNAEAEMTIWTMLEFNLHCPNLYFFVRHLNMEIEKGDATTRRLAYRLLVAAVQNPGYMEFAPSMLAVSALTIATTLVLKLDAMRSYVAEYGDDRRLEPCIQFMVSCYQVEEERVEEELASYMDKQWEFLFILENVLTLRKGKVETWTKGTQTDMA